MTATYESVDGALAHHDFGAVPYVHAHGREWQLIHPLSVWFRGGRVTENDFLTTNDPSSGVEIIVFDFEDKLDELLDCVGANVGGPLNLKVHRSFTPLTIQNANPLVDRDLPLSVHDLCPGDVCDVLVKFRGASRNSRLHHPPLANVVQIRAHRKTVLADRRFFAKRATWDQVEMVVCIIVCIRRFMWYKVPLEMEEEVLRWVEVGAGYE